VRPTKVAGPPEEAAVRARTQVHRATGIAVVETWHSATAQLRSAARTAQVNCFEHCEAAGLLPRSDPASARHHRIRTGWGRGWSSNEAAGG
jgi:hypothetical protein